MNTSRSVLTLLFSVGLVAGCDVSGKPGNSASTGTRPGNVFIAEGLQPLDEYIDSIPLGSLKRVEGSTAPILDEIFTKCHQGAWIPEEDIRRYASADDPGVDAWWKVEGRMLQMDGEGPAEAVLKLYETGSGAGYTIRVFFHRPGRMEFLELSGDHAGVGYREEVTLDDQVRDLDGDGIPELIIPVTPWYRGANTIAGWPLIYRFGKGNYGIADRAFPKFYETNVLPKYRALLGPEVPSLTGEVSKPHTEKEIRSWDLHQVLNRVDEILRAGSR